MKKLNDYQDEIHKCSKCGLCQSVCPVYKITGNDCSVSRGKFIMLNGIVKGDLKLNKNVNKYLDMCLKCNACKNFCPSGIDAREIFLTAKSEYFQNCREKKLISLFQSKPVFTAFLNLIKITSDTYRFLKVDKFIKKFYPLLFNFGWIGKKVIFANEFLEAKCKRQNAKSFDNTISPTSQTTNPPKIVYFKGCVNEYINPKTKLATEEVLSKMGVEILETKFQCCGVPFLSSGNTEQFKQQAIYNLSQIPEEFDYFLTDCASCQNAFIEYKQYIDDSKNLEKIDKLLEKSLNIIDFIEQNIECVGFDKKIKVTFHKPCHMENTTAFFKILSKTKDIEYVEMKDYDKCCGFSGEFALKNPELSTKISAEKAKNAIETGAEYILTSCPACILGLNQGMIENKKIVPAINIVELLAQGKFNLKTADKYIPCDKNLLDNFVKKCF